MFSAGAEHVLTGIATLLAALGVPSLAMWLVTRRATKVDDRERLVDVLRQALDKGRIRENAYCGALDALIAGIDNLPNPSPALVAARGRALDRLEIAHSQISGGEK